MNESPTKLPPTVAFPFGWKSSCTSAGGPGLIVTVASSATQVAMLLAMMPEHDSAYALPENITVPVGIACMSKLSALWPAVMPKSFWTLLFIPLATNRMQPTPVDGTLNTASIRALPCSARSLPHASMAARQTAGTIRIT